MKYLADIDFQTRLRKLIRDCNAVVDDYKGGRITEQHAFKQLAELEQKAFDEDKNAEPDGDYTYTVAMAMDEITSLE